MSRNARIALLIALLALSCAGFCATHVLPAMINGY